MLETLKSTTLSDGDMEIYHIVQEHIPGITQSHCIVNTDFQIYANAFQYEIVNEVFFYQVTYKYFKMHIWHGH